METVALILAANPLLSAEETPRIAAYRQRLPSPFLTERLEDDFRNAVEDTFSFTIELPPNSSGEPDQNGDRIIAHAAIFDRHRDGAWLEMGAFCIDPAWRGFGLQRTLANAMLAHLNEVGLIDISTVFAKIHSENPWSRDNAIDIGFQNTPPDDVLASFYGMTPAEFTQKGEQMFVLPQTAIFRVLQQLEAFVRYGCVVQNPRTQQKLHLKFAAPLEHFGDANYYEQVKTSRSNKAKRRGDEDGS